jgi:hypothetical protein
MFGEKVRCRRIEDKMRKIERAAIQEKRRNVSSRGLGTRISSLFAKVGLKEDIPELRGFGINPLYFDYAFNPRLRRRFH